MAAFGTFTRCQTSRRWGNLLAFLIPEVERSGATIRLNETVTVESVFSEGFDHIVIATGAKAVVPALQSDGFDTGSGQRRIAARS